MIITASDKAENFTYDPSRQTLFVVHKNTKPDALHEVHVTFDPPVQGRLAKRSWSGMTLVWGVLLAVLFAMVAQKALSVRGTI